MFPIFAVRCPVSSGVGYAEPLGNRPVRLALGAEPPNFNDIQLSQDGPGGTVTTRQTPLGRGVSHVVRLSAIKEVIGIYASGIVAGVTHKPLWPFTMSDKPSHSRCNSASAINNKSGSVLPVKDIPFPASIAGVDSVLAVEPLRYWPPRINCGALVRAVKPGAASGEIRSKVASAINTLLGNASDLGFRFARTRTVASGFQCRRLDVNLDTTMIANKVWGILGAHMNHLSCAMPRAVCAAPGLSVPSIIPNFSAVMGNLPEPEPESEG